MIDLESTCPANTADLATPALVVDSTCVQRNLERLSAFATRHSLKLRPHCKTHKSKYFARSQVNYGATGLTVAKVGEAEVMAEVCGDLLLAYPVVDQYRCERLAKLATISNVTVAIDSVQAAEALANAAVQFEQRIGILIDMDVGMKRTGVQNAKQAVGLAKCVENLGLLELKGIFCYPGHVWEPPDRQTSALSSIAESLQTAVESFDRHGLCRDVVSGGSTPTALQSDQISELTEIRPGTYIFNDMNTVRGGYCAIEDCAAKVICCVVSDAVPNQIVIDAGSKTLTTDRCIPAAESGFGLVIEYPDAQIVALSEEHGQVDITNCTERPRIGERVTVIPNHICPCINLMDAVWLHGSAMGRLQPITIDARGELT